MLTNLTIVAKLEFCANRILLGRIGSQNFARPMICVQQMPSVEKTFQLVLRRRIGNSLFRFIRHRRNNLSERKEGHLGCKGRSSRMQMKLPHTSGRRGSARTLKELKKQSHDGRVTRVQLFVVIHTKSDGPCPFFEARPILDEITRLVTLKTYLAHRDLNYDAVALTCHSPRKDRVLGYDDNVSKTVINVAAPYKEMVECEKRKREDTETDFSLVMQRLDEETKARKILEEKLAHLEDLSAAINQAGQCSTTPAVEKHAFPQSTHCLVKSFRKMPIAFGSIRTDVTSEDDSYQIRISKIYYRNASYMKEGRLMTFELEARLYGQNILFN